VAKPLLAKGWKRVRLIWILIMVASLAGVRDAKSAQTCKAPTYSADIVDESIGPEPHQSGMPSSAASDDPRFRQFVAAISEHVLTRLGGAARASKTSADKADIRLLFIRRPIVTADRASIVPASLLVLPRVHGERRLDSPWMSVTLSPPPGCRARAIFVWSERQLLLDQALLSGASTWPKEPLAPIQRPAFEKLKAAYQEFALSASSPGSIELHALADRIPADVLWLFRQSWPSRPGSPDFSDARLQAIIARASAGHIIFAKGVLDRVFNAAKDEQLLESVFDLRERT
jgi:hypothetical protein